MDDMATVPDTVRALETLLHEDAPSMSIEEALAGLGPQERSRLRTQLRDMIRLLIPGIDPRQMLAATIPHVPDPVSRASLQDLLALLEEPDAEFFERLVELEKARGITLPVEIFRTYQDRLLDRPHPEGGSFRDLLERDLAGDHWRSAWEAVPGHRGDEACDAGHTLDLRPGAPDECTPVRSFDGLIFDTGRPVPIPARVAENSRHLARFLNRLAGGGKQPPRLGLVGLPAGTHELEIEDLSSVPRALHESTGFTFEIHEARAFADFLDVSLMEGGRLWSVRIPTWIRSGADRVPAAHSEVLIVLRDQEGNVQALTTWFMSLPTGDAQQGVRFHPAIRRRASWSGYRIVRSFAGKGPASLFFSKVVPLMKSFNMLEDRHQVPRGGYGCLAICNDTTALVSAHLALRHRGDEAREARLRSLHATAVWPLVRDTRFDFYLARRLGDPAIEAALDEAGSLSLLPTDTHRSRALPVLSPEERWLRVGSNMPCRTLDTVSIPELCARLPGDGPSRSALERGLVFYEPCEGD